MIFCGVKVLIEPDAFFGNLHMHRLRVTVIDQDLREHEYEHICPDDYLRSHFDQIFDLCKEELRLALKKK